MSGKSAISLDTIHADGIEFIRWSQLCQLMYMACRVPSIMSGAICHLSWHLSSQNDIRNLVWVMPGIICYAMWQQTCQVAQIMSGVILLCQVTWVFVWNKCPNLEENTHHSGTVTQSTRVEWLRVRALCGCWSSHLCPVSAYVCVSNS